MLSQVNPISNILLEREVRDNKLRATQRVDTANENWMEPFGLILGLNSNELVSWRNLFFSNTQAMLLVEGDIDKEYFELLRADEHGNNRLEFDGEIFAYGGSGSIENSILLRFIKNRHKKLFITYDLDVEAQVEKNLKALGFQRGLDYEGIGKDEPGKKNIEGLLPDHITSVVYAQNAGLVSQAMNGTKEEQKEAKRELKRKILKEFKVSAQPTDEFFGCFYPFISLIRLCLVIR